jgi:hypothetical protein
MNGGRSEGFWVQMLADIESVEWQPSLYSNRLKFDSISTKIVPTTPLRIPLNPSQNPKHHRNK